MLLLANRFPFVAVSIAFAVNKEVSKRKRKAEVFMKHLEIASVLFND